MTFLQVENLTGVVLCPAKRDIICFDKENISTVSSSSVRQRESSNSSKTTTRFIIYSSRASDFLTNVYIFYAAVILYSFWNKSSTELVTLIVLSLLK